MNVKSASNTVVVRDGIVKRQLTVKEVRKSLFCNVLATIIWIGLTILDDKPLQRVSHIILVLIFGIQVVSSVDQLRRLRRGEIIEVAVAPKRPNARKRSAIVIAAFVTAIATVATCLNLGSVIPLVFLALFIWLPLLYVWYRILTGGDRPTLTGSHTSNAVAEEQTPQAHPAASAAPAHWWTQNAVRDDVHVQSVGNSPQTNDR